ncbi:protein kinase [Heterostelium album PN500]|uniref:non-specific serine/threonine protein kinase n=1 Tax=Heterostelium pallidum (strain ATCC 26659 / Pp 5 / PN500) TaxID=670386 RepID=D3AX52_HETP5|nr:protein kinase [Heterostelium album PN500]EFA86121.1 protein kinase [Heterostelium album PN500]|eukprot:XP_020438226.1 protein kinase [Heterostelium album PN500]
MEGIVGGGPSTDDNTNNININNITNNSSSNSNSSTIINNNNNNNNINNNENNNITNTTLTNSSSSSSSSSIDNENNNNNNNNNNNIVILNKNTLTSSTSSIATTTTTTSSNTTPIVISSLKKELSPYSVPYIPQPQPIHINSSSNNNNSLSSSSSTLNVNSLPYKPSSSTISSLQQQQQQQQQPKILTNTNNLSIINNINNSNYIGTNSSTSNIQILNDRLTKENIEQLFANRFHSKNNIREAVTSTFNSLLYTLENLTTINNNNNNNNSNVNVVGGIGVGLGGIGSGSISVTGVIGNVGSSGSGSGGSGGIATGVSQFQYLLDLVGDMIDMIRLENDYIIKLFKTSTEKRPNVNNITTRTTLLFINKPATTATTTTSSSGQLSDGTTKPTTLPYDDNDSFYISVLTHNLNLSTKIAKTIYSLQNNQQQPQSNQQQSNQQQQQINDMSLSIETLLLKSVVGLYGWICSDQSDCADTAAEAVRQYKGTSSEYCDERTTIESRGSDTTATRNTTAQFTERTDTAAGQRDIPSTLLTGLLHKVINRSIDTTQIGLISKRTESTVLLSDTDINVQKNYLCLLSKTVSQIEYINQKNQILKVNDISLPYKLLLMRSQGVASLSFTDFFKLIFDTLYNSSLSMEPVTKIIMNQFFDINFLATFQLDHNNRVDLRRVEQLLVTSDELMWFWTMWECARYCITYKLKTPFGTGVQTFGIFESIILQLNKERTDFKKIKIMLTFMESLEKQIFSAAYGSVILPSPQAKEVYFFKINWRVSEDWFSRIRINLLKASILCCSAPDIIRHASLRIADIRANRFIDPANAQFELEFCVLHLTNALSIMNETEMLQGLSKWIDINYPKVNQQQLQQQVHQQHQQHNSNVKLSTPWINGIILASQQRYEEAIQSLSNLVETTEPNVLSFPFVVEHSIKCYLELSDYTELDHFLHKHGSRIKSTNIAYRERYLSALASFSRSDMETSRAFVSELIAQPTSPVQGGLAANSIATEELILAMMIIQRDDNQHSSSSSTAANFQSFASRAHSYVHEALAVVGHESNVQTFQYLAQLKIIDELENGVAINANHEITGESNNELSHPLGFLERLRRTRNHLSAIQHRHDLLFHNIPLTETLIKLSRKSGNLKFTNRLLNSILESHCPSYHLERSKLKYKQDRRLESFTDLIKYTSQFGESSNSTSVAIQAKSYRQIIKELLANCQSAPFQEYLQTQPAEYSDPEYFFRKATTVTPRNPKLLLSYANWALESAEQSRDEQVRNRLYQCAVERYFEYLECDVESGTTIETTLRLLNILVNHGHQIIETFENCLAMNRSSKYFANIVPQLFARLNHNDRLIQQLIVDIINEIGRDNPHAIVFPTLVSGGHPSIHKELSRHSPVLVRETEEFIKGLEQLTILWEDRWQQLMEEIHAWIYHVRPRWLDEYQAMKKAKLSHTTSRIKRKNLQLFMPILEKIRKLLSATLLGQCTTAYERWFISVHYEMVNKVIRNVEKQTKPSNPFLSLQELIQHFAVNRLQVIDITAVNPSLHEFRPTSIKMPGITEGEVMVQSIHSQVLVLPTTKTKPKKLTILGNDGVAYAFLLKGREDLHLDARVMQLLNVIDQLMKTNKQRQFKLLRTRNYAVVPLSRAAGLIQWVENAVPMFSIFKNWYRNELSYKGVNPSALTTPPLPRQSVRPVDIFYSKLDPLFAEHGLTRGMLHRNEWPKDILRKVFIELTAETPKWLLSRELWYSSCSTSELFLKTQSFTRSIAVMSMIGYLIGLGDRHLDNILLDMKTGEIIHIDYNICFEKGLQLKVPEKVPFRMTQMIEHALGLTGIHGTFSETCNIVLDLLRKNKQTLLNILETFIYEPLTDWKIKQINETMKDNNDDNDQEEDNKNKEEEFENNDSDNEHSSEEESTTEQFDLEDGPQMDNDAKEMAKAKEDIKCLQGLTIFNQVKNKLEGTEQKLSVEAQVEMIIKESLRIDNLAVMYEGWTPWI